VILIRAIKKVVLEANEGMVVDLTVEQREPNVLYLKGG
jgi:hypothetical protein